MKDEKEERKKQARSNKQTRQSNTAHPRQSLFLEKMSCLRWDSNPRHSILYVHVLMRDEKVGRKKQARSNKQQQEMNVIMRKFCLEITSSHWITNPHLDCLSHVQYMYTCTCT